ncbi:hypothetical protein BABINDRAFT_10105, partial [Babjeviella inositovora NRRL Y-12698]
MLSYLTTAVTAIFLLKAVAAASVSNAFSDLTLVQSIDLNNIGKDLPFNVWKATLDWDLPAGTQPGDTFSLTMPHTFRAVGSPGFDLVAGNVTYATCKSINGGLVLDHSTLTCTVTNAISTVVNVSGTLTFNFVFASGGSANSFELADAAFYQAGTNVITWTQDGGNALTTTVDFGTGGFSQKGNLNYYSRNLPDGTFQSYFLSHACPSSQLKQGFLSITDSTSRIICSEVSAWVTDEINTWEFPMQASQTPANFQIQCSPSQASVSYTGINPGYRVFLTTNMQQKAAAFVLDYFESYLCDDGETDSISLASTVIINDASSYSNGTADFEITTTSYWSNTFTSTTTLPFGSTDHTATVVVEIPFPTTETITITSTGTGSAETTVTAPFSSGATVITVTDILPSPSTETVTVTSTGTGSVETIVTAPFTSGATVIT